MDASLCRFLNQIQLAYCNGCPLEQVKTLAGWSPSRNVLNDHSHSANVGQRSNIRSNLCAVGKNSNHLAYTFEN